MSEQETMEGSGGWEIPSQPDYDALYDELMEYNFTFRKLTGGPEVFLHGNENEDLKKIAARNGFTFRSVEVVEGPHAARVRVEKKKLVRNTEDAEENLYRVADEEEDQ